MLASILTLDSKPLTEIKIKKISIISLLTKITIIAIVIFPSILARKHIIFQAGIRISRKEAHQFLLFIITMTLIQTSIHITVLKMLIGLISKSKYIF
jgi:hypothetical protein